MGCVISYVLGSFPWGLFSLLLRDQYLAYETSRILTPILGAIVIIRALLGPGIFIKLYSTWGYILRVDYFTRERVGRALQSDKTRHGAVVAALSFALIGSFLCSAIDLSFLSYGFAIFLIAGAVYGAGTGCYHSLPIRPWFVFTALKGGIWLEVEKRTICPCKKCCLFCTDLHQFKEMFLIFPTNDLHFFSLLKSSCIE